MSTAAGLLTQRAPAKWTNHHGTVTVPVRASLTLRNHSAASTMAGMRATAGNLQTIIRGAVSQSVRLRAVGSRWSFSEIAAAPDGWALETDNLDMAFRVSSNSLDPAYHGSADDLFLVQCGRSISRINMALEDPGRGRALRTSGASNGQTIAGAIGTGTHGSAIDVGGLESQVGGFQLLTAERNLWIERPAEPIMNGSFAAQLGAELVRDTALFRAGLVSLGALGVIHSVLLRTTARYLLRSTLRRMKTSDVEHAMRTLDFADAPLPDPTRRPYFFQVIVDPARPEHAYVTTRYKDPCPPDRISDFALKSGYEPGNDLPGLVGKLLTVAPRLRGEVVSVLIKTELKEFSGRLKTPGETYDYTSSRSGVAGSAIAVPVSKTINALARVRQAFHEHPGAPVVCACRYAQKSLALLGFTRFDPTCIVDIDGVDSKATRRVMERTRELLDRDAVPYTSHWGKMHWYTRARVRTGYGSHVDLWNEVRRRLLPNPIERHVFSTPLLDALGLNE